MKHGEFSCLENKKKFLTLQAADSKIVMVLTSATSTQIQEKSLIHVMTEKSEELIMIGRLTSLTTPLINFG